MKTYSTTEAPAAIGPYSQAVEGGGLLFLSGQIAIIPETGELNIANLDDEVRQIFANIQAVLKAAELNLSHVVKCSIFLKSMGDFAKVNEIYGEYFSESLPARACVEVAGLPKNVNVEIEVIAEKQ